MLSCFDFVRDFSVLSIAVRMTFAVVCGGIIGIEREYKRRPAGFRTHILICLGAAITTLTSQHIVFNMQMYTDLGRLGAQVVAGIGFIGAGTIIVTKRQRVKGLTTAAGLWTAAIIGLVCGAGFVECALFATLMVLVAELLLIKIEYRFAKKINDVTIYVEYRHAIAIEGIIRILREHHMMLNDLEITRVSGEGDEHYYCAVITISSRTDISFDIVGSLNTVEDVISVEEL